jgi:class III poly(R)-hydroxyalkanoic acid synthase PhaE subunit
MSEAWMNAFRQMMRRLNERSERGEPLTSLKQLIEAWTDTADDAFNEVFESQRYIDSQARLLNSSMALRRKQQEIVDDLLKGSYIPGRSEVDEAHRSIYELRKEVRELKRRIKDLEAIGQAKVAATPAPRAKRTVRPTSKRAPKRRSK